MQPRHFTKRYLPQPSTITGKESEPKEPLNTSYVLARKMLSALLIVMRDDK